MANDAGTEQTVEIATADGEVLTGDLAVPPDSSGTIVFAHGSGSSRRSPRNRMVAATLRERSFATLLFDLLTPTEEIADARSGQLRFNIDLLAGRLADAAELMQARRDTEHLPIGYFGASTGAAAALVAAARRSAGIGAIVSRGGRADLAGPHLADVRAPTLLIVGGLDDVIIRLNEHALRQLRVETRLEIVPGATHLFEEPGTMQRVAQLAGDWFVEHLTEAGHLQARDARGASST